MAKDHALSILSVMPAYTNKQLLRQTPKHRLTFSLGYCCSLTTKRALLSYLAIPILLCSLPALTKSAGNESAQSSAASSASMDRPLKTKEEREAEQLKDVAKSLDNKTSGITSNEASAVWLNADNQDFLGIYTPAAKAKTSGTVLILHDEGEHPLWPGAILNLQNYLPEKGWATFSIALPDQTYPDPPPRPTAEELVKHTFTSTKGSAKNNAGNSPANNNPNTNQQEQKYNDRLGKEAIENQAQNRITAAIKYLNKDEENGIVLYGQGLGGLRAGAYLKALIENADSSIDTFKALIIVDSPNEIALIEKDSQKTVVKTLLARFKNTNFPILDIISDASTLNIEQAKRRRIEARRATLNKYHQRPIVNLNKRIFLTNIYGFLKTNI